MSTIRTYCPVTVLSFISSHPRYLHLHLHLQHLLQSASPFPNTATERLQHHSTCSSHPNVTEPSTTLPITHISPSSNFLRDRARDRIEKETKSDQSMMHAFLDASAFFSFVASTPLISHIPPSASLRSFFCRHFCRRFSLVGHFFFASLRYGPTREKREAKMQTDGTYLRTCMTTNQQYLMKEKFPKVWNPILFFMQV